MERAAELLRALLKAALPTETVYGLAANAWNVEAVRRIDEAKGRPAENPIIVLVASLDLARRCVSALRVYVAGRLAAAFWPGPLTLVSCRARRKICRLVTAGGATVGVRWPDHPLIQAVIQACGFPLAGAQRQSLQRTFTHHRPTSSAKVCWSKNSTDYRWRALSQVGLESSVIDLASTPARLLRPGMISAESLQTVLGEGAVEIGGAPAPIARSPGQLPRHYSPKAKLVVLRWRDEGDLAAQVSAFGLARGKIHIVTHHRIPLRRKIRPRGDHPPGRRGLRAGALYAELHRSR